ncbi:MAG: 50S ribosome-binding GTPase [Pseudooceanicola sp.]|nr:50S ribosome-binding GTPase [Pseudooceanicola sp.]
MTHPRKPRVLIAGEFSAGKTRLLNALLGTPVLPSHVTSTSLPPMWLVEGNGAPLRLDMSGDWYETGDIETVEVLSTRFCVLRAEADILRHIDLIDTPGNSDPNIPAECWERVVGFADMVIWCSNANQAWRQTEKAVWDEMPDHLRRSSLMVLTHADLMPDDTARDKVLRRARREAGDYFAGIEMVSPIDAREVAVFAARLTDHALAIPALEGDEAPDFAPRLVLPPAPAAGSVRRARGKRIVPRRLVLPAQG